MLSRNLGKALSPHAAQYPTVARHCHHTLRNIPQWQGTVTTRCAISHSGKALSPHAAQYPTVARHCHHTLRNIPQWQGTVTTRCAISHSGKALSPHAAQYPTVARHCHHTLRNIPQCRRSHLLRGGSLKLNFYLFDICHLVFSRLEQDLNAIFHFLNMYHSMYSQILFSL